MKINWGLRIILLYSGFVIFMLALVYKCTQQKFDLVAKDYYAQELAYQKVIDGSHNKRELQAPIKIEQQGQNLLVQLPASQAGLQNGKIFFYRPSDASKDRVIDFSAVNTIISQEKFIQGLYKVKLTWDNNGKHYFDEQSIYIQ
jgi:hypothetical protein